ncbi:MAG: hypothetical protein JW747_03380 [Candidatus Aminicenantes bacterium]|nr:hypothetical protein [Candidatus Aminicenantes bacterium]
MKKKTAVLIALLFLSTFAFSDEITRTLKLPAEGIQKLSVEAGAGSLEILGVEGLSGIEVEAEIYVRGIRERRLDDFLKDHLRLSLEKDGSRAVLKAYIEFRGISFFGGESSVDLKVRLPRTMALDIDDGSGWMTVEEIRSDVRIDDGSGELSVRNIDGNLVIDDGSGDIEIRGVTGDVRIDDGSGSIRVVRVGGTVTVDDGSGSIVIDDVDRDVVLESTGSGSVRTNNVRGRVVR